MLNSKLRTFISNKVGRCSCPKGMLERLENRYILISKILNMSENHGNKCINACRKCVLFFLIKKRSTMLFHGLQQSNIPNGQTASSLCFSSNLVRAMHACGSGEAARRAKRGRKHEKKKERLFRASPVSRHQSRAWPFACLAFCLTDYRKKRHCSQST